ncbi:hypothetical protein K457DRAFT_373355 [Linnemannia elongata AG-77]|uniref:Zn(2)-C6 fungal-type domain-containing protein n=1 Tax=Linnemannia elongata AG-77 TaxID=1314771 RepID=A0A197KHJ1_9FUNG|nr:hypothetical protein K457DRAFT_373355 [Linnemannia elongata AG-77]
MFYSPGQSHVYPSQDDDDALWESPAPDNTSRPSSPSPAPNKDNNNSSTAKSTASKKDAPPKRIRISIACVSCRHKKIKCDGQVPCSHCVKSAGKCVYPAATKPVNHQYVETLENRLKSVEMHLKELLAKGAGEASGVSNPEHQQQQIYGTADSQSSSTHGSRPASHYIPLAAKSSLTNSRRPTGSSPSSLLGLTPRLTGDEANSSTQPGSFAKSGDHTDGSGANTNMAETCSMEVLEILLGNLKVERDGTAKFLPGLMQQQEESYAQARTYSKPGPPGLSPMTDIPILDWESTELPKPYTLPTSLLSPKAINALIDLYFKSVHTFLPILHKPSFLTLCQEGEFRVPPFLLMAMCAVASCHANEVELEEITKFDSFKSHHVLFDYARSLMDTYLDIPRLSTLQGLLLLTYYQVKAKRAGQYFRVRSYLGLAVHMALDMGLARDFYVHIEELESSSVFDNVLGNSNSVSTTISSSTLAQRLGPNNDALKSKVDKARWTVTQQERHLTWLGCYFLDGIISSLAGQEYCVAHGQLETRKLIRAANSTADTAQAATLIFWFVHLDLVKQRRRISEMYRALSLSPHRSHEAAIISSIAESTEMRSIEHALDNWLTTLPVHLVYPERKSTSCQNGEFSESSLPSYYTLYLHRFYYSHELLLYRPLITLAAYQGDLSDPKSPLSKCARAAAMLTEIGEIIFQNYRWPWPGCGLFGYHMIQAIEIHVMLMVNYGKTDAQELFYKTMGLLKGFVSLAKLPELEKAILSMEQMVTGYIMNPESVSSLHWINNSNTPGSVLQRYHQLRQQQEVANSDNGSNNGNNAMPLSEQSSLGQTPVSSNYGSLGAISMSPITPAISHLMQQHLHMNTQQQRSQLNSPLMNDSSSAAPHIYSPLAAANMGYNSLTGAANSLTGDVGELLQSNHHNGQGYGIHGANASGVLNTTTSANDTRSHAASSPISSFLYNMDAPTPMSLYHQSAQDMLPYTNYLASGGSGVDDLVDFESMVSPPPPSSTPLPGNLLPTPGLRSSLPPPTGVPPSRDQDNNNNNSQRAVTFLAPPKPPKRIHHQFTGSTNSSSKSQSQRPPVPKKPSRLMSTIGGNTSWISPSTPYPSTMSPPYLDNPHPPSHYSNSSNGHGRYMSDNHNGDDGSAVTDSTPLLVGQPAPPVSRRPLRVLQAQTQLYGLGALQNPYDGSNEKAGDEVDPTGDGFDADQYAIDIMSDPHISNKVLHHSRTSRSQVL